MNRDQKQEQIDHLREVFRSATSGVLTGFRGITVEEVNRLRTNLRKEGVAYQVIKNTLAKKAIEGTDLADLIPLLEGPTGLATTTADPAAPAKVLKAFVKDNTKVTIKGGFVDGHSFAAADVDRVASMPGKNELRAMILGAMNGAPRGIVSLCNEIPASFVRLLNARREELEKQAAPAAETQAQA